MMRITRDDWGVPHIQAGTEHDAFYALGYAQAEDQLPVILRNYAVLTGSAERAFGSAHADVDVLNARWDHCAQAKRGYAQISDELRDVAEAFAAGLRRYMQEHPEKVPEWAPRPEGWMALAMHRLFLWPYAVGDAITTLVSAGIALDPQVLREIAASVALPGASNQWVVMPGRTAAGALALLSDPHGSLVDLPMFEFGLMCEDLHVAGFSVVGSALPILGHTAQVAWAMTTGAPRVSDCFSLELAGEDAYVLDGITIPFSTSSVHANGVTHRIDWAQINGLPSPVLARHEGRAYVACTPYMDATHVMEQELYAWLHAQDVKDFKEAMRSCGMFAQNIMAGDSAGHALYVRAGRVPRRPIDVDPGKPIDGSDSRNWWLGLHELDELVQIADPTTGYMHNNNVAPDMMFPGASEHGLGLSANTSYLFNDTAGRSTTRGTRASELLGRCVSASSSQLMEIALDDTWPGFDRWLDALATALESQDLPTADVDRRFLQRILDFDGHASAQSTSALAYVTWRDAIRYHPELSESETFEVWRIVESGLALPAAWQSVLVKAVSAAATAFVAEHGGEEIAFGALHRIGRGGASYPASGGAHLSFGKATSLLSPDITSEQLTSPLRVFAFGPPAEDGLRWPIAGGRSLRFVQFTDPITSYSVLLFGQNADPASPHHSDQAELVGQRRMKPTYFQLDELALHTSSTTELEEVSKE